MLQAPTLNTNYKSYGDSINNSLNRFSQIQKDKLARESQALDELYKKSMINQGQQKIDNQASQFDTTFNEGVRQFDDGMDLKNKVFNLDVTKENNAMLRHKENTDLGYSQLYSQNMNNEELLKLKQGEQAIANLKLQHEAQKEAEKNKPSLVKAFNGADNVQETFTNIKKALGSQVGLDARLNDKQNGYVDMAIEGLLKSLAMKILLYIKKILTCF